jgi:transposase
MSDATQKSDRKQYSQELKAEAIRLVLEHGYTCDAAGQKLGVPPKTLANWARPHRRENRRKQISVGVENNDPAALRAQIVELQKQLRRAEMERDILKKFSQYAANQMPGGLP